MNRVVQSAGRIVRSETDRGIIVLLDKRFAYENLLRLSQRLVRIFTCWADIQNSGGID
jgi:Rad3-related DNA helicase